MNQRVGMEFYALGKLDKMPNKFEQAGSNMGVMDTGNDLLTRNALSLNSNNLEAVRNSYRNLHTLSQARKETNNYLFPVDVFSIREKPQIRNEMLNKATYDLERKKYFTRDLQSTLETGQKLDKKDYMKRKLDLPVLKNVSNTKNEVDLKEANFYFDKNNKEMIRFPKGLWNDNSKLKQRTRISEQAPEWFHSLKEDKLKEHHDNLEKNEETLFVFSKHQRWITVTPKNQNRQKPLEKLKYMKKEDTSKIMPKWMQIKHENYKIKEDIFKSVPFSPILNGKKYTVLVDKSINQKVSNSTTVLK